MGRSGINEDFYAGMLCALAVVESLGEDAIHDQIVQTVPRDELLRVARKFGDMKLSGMARSERIRKRIEASGRRRAGHPQPKEPSRD